MAESDARQKADAGEPEALMQPERSCVVGIDIADDLPKPRRSTYVDQFPHQHSSDTAADMVVVNIDRVFHGVAISGAFAEQHDISVAENLSAARRHEMREATIFEVLPPVAQIVGLRHLGVADAFLDALADVATIDRQHRIDVSIARRPHDDRMFGFNGQSGLHCALPIRWRRRCKAGCGRSRRPRDRRPEFRRRNRGRC